MQALELDAARRYESIPALAFCAALPARGADEHAHVQSAGLALAAEIDGELVGFLLALTMDGRAHIFEAAVGRRHQGCGYGRQLIAAFEDWGRASGYGQATLTTYRDAPWNAPFYARLGFNPFDVGPNRPELLALRAAERAAGLDRASRVAMRKSIGSGA